MFKRPTKKFGQVALNGELFQAEIAETMVQKVRGLSGHEYLHDNHGMLFVFKVESIHPFTTRHMLIPLDIIWINRFEEIVHISKNAKPCRTIICPAINPWKRSKYVFEVNAGISTKLGLKIGDRAVINLPA